MPPLHLVQRGDQPRFELTVRQRRDLLAGLCDPLQDLLVDRWTTRDQKRRWLATTLLELEPRLRGYRALPQLRVALKQGIAQGKEVMVA